jgi:hypothetical protein
MVINFWALAAKTHYIFVARNAWVSDLVCLCVMEDMNCAKQWMVERTSALKKVCRMDGRRSE